MGSEEPKLRRRKVKTEMGGETMEAVKSTVGLRVEMVLVAP